MSNNKTTTINVQPVLDLQSLHEQLNCKKFKINVDFDTSALNTQIQASIGQSTASLQPVKVPVEADTKSIMDYVSLFNTTMTTRNNIANLTTSISKSLD